MRRGYKFILAERHVDFTRKTFACVVEIDRLEGRLEQRGTKSALTRTIYARAAALLPSEFQDRAAAIARHGPGDVYVAAGTRKRAVFQGIGGKLMQRKREILRILCAQHQIGAGNFGSSGKRLQGQMHNLA